MDDFDLNEPEHAAGAAGPQSATIALVGPSGGGKTLTALALGAARLPFGAGDRRVLQMRVTPRFDPDSQERAADIGVTALTLPPSGDAAARYDFDVELPTPPEPLLHAVVRWMRTIRTDALTSLFEADPPETAFNVRVRIVDGPGALFFPTREERGRVFLCGPKVRALVQGAQALVLCVNAAEPSQEAIRLNIASFISQMTQVDGYLPFRAVLVLLTHVDQRADRVLTTLRGLPREGASPALRFFQTHPAATPFHVCRHAHARELARSVVGEMPLYQLWRHLRAGSKFGIGVASAVGLSTADAPWMPLGLDEALYFGLNGDAARDRRLGTIMEYVADSRPGPPSGNASQICLEGCA